MIIVIVQDGVGFTLTTTSSIASSTSLYSYPTSSLPITVTRVEANTNVVEHSVFCCPGPIGFILPGPTRQAGEPIVIELEEPHGVRELVFDGLLVIEVYKLPEERLVYKHIASASDLPLRVAYTPEVVEDTMFKIVVRAVKDGREVDRIETETVVLAGETARGNIKLSITYKVIKDPRIIGEVLKTIKEFEKKFNASTITMSGRSLWDWDREKTIILLLKAEIENADNVTVYLRGYGPVYSLVGKVLGFKPSIAYVRLSAKPMKGDLYKPPASIGLVLGCTRLKPGEKITITRYYLVELPAKIIAKASASICDYCPERCANHETEKIIELP